MKLYKSHKIRFFAGLFLILIVYTLYYLLFVDTAPIKIPTFNKHFITLSTTLIIYFIGTFHLGKLPDNWMSFVWHITHITGLFILSALGLYDWLINDLSLNLKSFARSIKEILISPVLYVGMGLINTSFRKK